MKRLNKNKEHSTPPKHSPWQREGGGGVHEPNFIKRRLPMQIITDLEELYELDDVQWLDETIKLLKDQQFEALDLDNLIEELSTS